MKKRIEASRKSRYNIPVGFMIIIQHDFGLWSHPVGTEVRRLPDPEYIRAIDLSRKIAAEVGTPRFYLEREREVSLSRELFASSPLVEEGMRIVGERGNCLGHGLTHVRKVAIDAGALILIEEETDSPVTASCGWFSWRIWPASSTISGGRRRIMPNGVRMRRSDF
jgi:hypothetical protein